MLIINPIEITRSDFDGTPTPGFTVAAWDIGTQYYEEEFTRVDDIVYQAVRDTIGDAPASSPDDWLEYGVSNPLKPFDGIINSRATYDGDIVYAINSVDFISGLTLLDMTNIKSVTIIIEDSGSAVIYEYNPSFPYDELALGVTTIALIDIPLYKNVLITITLRQNDTSINAEVGEIVLGKTSSLGITEYGASTGIIDYSTKTQDDFGNFSIVARAFSKKSAVKLKVLPGQVDYTVKTLTNLRSTPLVWIINDKTQYSGILILYGFYKDFKITLPDCAMAKMTLNIEGLV